VTLGSARVFAKETATIPLEAPRTGGEKRINISYDASRLKATGISGACNPTWQVDQNTGSLSVLLPKGCGSANLNFTANQPINANATIELLITGTSGFKPETISNGTITIAAEQIATKKGNALGFFASLFALALGFCACRRALE
jgi:hypothetical protein